MFTNREAIETLVKCDSSATKREKGYVLSLLHSRPLVVKVEEAAYMLGMTRHYIYKCLKNGSLKGIYGPSAKTRAVGVLVESIDALLDESRQRAICGGLKGKRRA